MTEVLGGKQLGLLDHELLTAKKLTKRKQLHSEMNVVMPRPTLIDITEPHYPKVSTKVGHL